MKHAEIDATDTESGTVITPKDQSWRLVVPKDGGFPILFVRTAAIAHPRALPEDTYIASTGVFDKHGRELPAKFLHQLGLRVIGRDLMEKVTEAWDAEDPSPAIVEASDAIYKALDEHPLHEARAVVK